MDLVYRIFPFWLEASGSHISNIPFLVGGQWISDIEYSLSGWRPVDLLYENTGAYAAFPAVGGGGG